MSGSDVDQIRAGQEEQLCEVWSIVN